MYKRERTYTITKRRNDHSIRRIIVTETRDARWYAPSFKYDNHFEQAKTIKK
jgi:hypothetical protein